MGCWRVRARNRVCIDDTFPITGAPPIWALCSPQPKAAAGTTAPTTTTMALIASIESAWKSLLAARWLHLQSAPRCLCNELLATAKYGRCTILLVLQLPLPPPPLLLLPVLLLL